MRGIEQIPWLYDLSMTLMPGVQRWRRSLARLARGRVLEVGCAKLGLLKAGLGRALGCGEVLADLVC